MTFNIDFIGIGAQRSGTTWIYKCLDEHPDITVSKSKEINFFNEVVDIGSEKNNHYGKGINWYKKFFENSNKIKGEYSIFYLPDKKTPYRIKKHFPNVKIIVCLRNPIDRSYSDYRLLASVGRLGNLSFEEAINKFPKFTGWGMYYKQLKPYYDLFPKKNIKVLIFEDIEKDPSNFIKDLYSFLEVDDNFIPNCLNTKINEIKEVRNIFMLKKASDFKEKFLKDMSFGVSLVRFLNKLGLIRLFFKKNKNLKIDLIPENLREKLNLIFMEDIKKLEKLISKDLSEWK